jgi:8-oxo-dGTP diphosphatase
MCDIDSVDSNSIGAKGLLYIGDKLLLYRRDGNTTLEPHKIDVPGGGPFEGESPFMNFAREVKEEFGLELQRQQIVYAKAYPHSQDTSRTGYFLVARLPDDAKDKVVFGDEGEKWFLLSIDEYLSAKDAWVLFQVRTRDYLSSLI